MAQHDGVIANQGFPAFRSDLNDALAAIFSTHSGTSAPTGVVAGQFWLDTDTPSATVRTLFHYDGTDSIGIMQIDYTNNYVTKFGIGIQPSSMNSGSLLHLKSGASSTTADTSGDELVIEGNNTCTGMTLLNETTSGDVAIYLGTGTVTTGANIYYSPDAETNGTLSITAQKTSSKLLLKASNTEVLRLTGGTGSQHVYMNDTSDSNVSMGITLNQSTNDDAILTGKSSDVAHGGVAPYETDTYLALGKYSSTVGGARLTGASESAEGCVHIQGGHTAASSTTTKTTANWNSIIQITGNEHASGGGAEENITADGNVFSISTYKGGGNTWIFGVDEDGDIYSDSSATVNVFDEFDDAHELAQSNNILAALADDAKGLVPSPEYFKSLYRQSQAKLWGYCGPRMHQRGGRPTMNVTAHVRLLVGEAGQRANREAVYVQAQHEQSLRLRAAEERLGIPAGPTFIERCSELAVGRNVGRLPAPINLS